MTRFSLHMLAAAVAVIGIGSAPASAQWAPATECDQQPSGYEIEDCLKKALAAADDALNGAYRKAEAAIAADPETPSDQKKTWHDDLVAAQRAWVAFRDANCKFELIGAEWHGGSGATAAQEACVLAATRARTAELLDRYAPPN